MENQRQLFQVKQHEQLKLQIKENTEGEEREVEEGESKREEKSDGKRIYGEFMSCRVASMCY